MKNHPRTVFFNGRFLAQPRTGVQRFAEELLTEFDRLVTGPDYSDYRFVCLVPPENDALRLPDWQNIHIKVCGIFKGNLWEQMDLPFHARGGLLANLCNIGAVLHPSQIVVIHDASVFAVPEAYSFTFRLKYKFIYFVLTHTAWQVFTVSQFSQKELSHFLHMPQEKIKVLSEGCEHILQVQADTSILEKFALRRKAYFLAVGSASRHKNLNAVIKAMQGCKDKFPGLVIAGGSFSKVFQSEETIPDNQLMRLGYVTDAQLRALYENALAFVFPSLYEGFGLPPLEAMICNCPVIVSDRASLPEVCGGAALYFDPERAEQISECLQRVAGSQAIRNELRQKGLERARQFTWKKAAYDLLQSLMSEER